MELENTKEEQSLAEEDSASNQELLGVVNADVTKLLLNSLQLGRINCQFIPNKVQSLNSFQVQILNDRAF